MFDRDEVPEKAWSKDVINLDSAKTANGKSLRTNAKNGSVMVDKARVVKTDIECANGVIHVIDTVVLPN